MVSVVSPLGRGASGPRPPAELSYNSRGNRAALLVPTIKYYSHFTIMPDARQTLIDV